MADTSFVARSTRIVSTWLQAMNDFVYRGRNPLYVTSTGSTNAYVVTLPATSLYSTLTAGDTFTFKAHAVNTGASTLQIVGASSMTAKNIYFGASSALSGGEIQIGDLVTVTYDGTQFQMKANGRFTPSGTGATTRTVQQELRETVTPFQFGGAGDGITNDSAAVLAASVAAVAQGKDVDFGGHTWLLGTQIALTSSHTGLRWRMRGATIKKGFSGDLMTITGCAEFAITGVGRIDGQHGTYTGKGIVFSGADSTSPLIGEGIILTSFTDSHVEFGADSGQYAKLLCHFYPSTGQTDFRAVHCTGTDTIGMFRRIIGSLAIGGYHQLAGAFDTVIGDSAFNRVETDSSCTITMVSNCVWGNGGNPMTISGGHCVIVGNRFAGNVTLDSNFSGVFADARFTSGKLINQSPNAVVVGDKPAVSCLANYGSQGAVGITTSETAISTISIPGGMLRAADAVKVTCYWSITDNANDKTLRNRIGASGDGLTGAVGMSFVATTSSSAITEMVVQNSDSTSAQAPFSCVTLGGTTTGSQITNVTSTAIDTTADWEVVVSGQKENSADTITLMGYRVELIRKP